MFVFSELDHIAAVREPDITPLGQLHSSQESGGGGGERGASQPNHDTKMLEEKCGEAHSHVSCFFPGEARNWDQACLLLKEKTLCR